VLVLCSTVSASRPAVNEEVRLFRSRHPDRPVIPVIIDGTPPDNFPPALRYELGADGTITDQPITVLGPDLRDNGDGKSLGLAKVIAGLLGIGTDEVFRRAERARNRRNRFWGALAGVFLVLALAATVSAVYAWHQLKTNEAFLNATLKRATEIVNEAVTQVEKYSVPHAATLALLDKAEGMFDDMAQYGRPTPELLYRKAWMLIQFARNYAILGDTGKQSARANEAHRLLAGLSAQKPDDVTYQVGLAAGFQEVGHVLVAQGNLTKALKSYRDSLAIMERLAKADPNNADWQRDLSISSRKIGDVLVAQGNLTEALKSYRDALTIAERLVNADPNNADWQHNLSVSYGKVGNALVAQGNLTEALKSYRDSLAIMERLAKADPNNAVWQRALAISNEQLGDICAEQKESDEAKASFERALAIYDKLKASFPDDTRALVNSSVPLMALGELYGPDGRAYLQRALAILKQLDEAGRLEPRRKPSIARIEERLVELQEAEASPK
jgi:tetratricopeptide (TPR) repeat protein